MDIRFYPLTRGGRFYVKGDQIIEVSYRVKRDYTLSDLHLEKKSQDRLLNSIAMQTVMSVAGDCSLLAFPKGSGEESITKIHKFRYAPSDPDGSAQIQFRERKK
jgi:hypothetical protein